MPEARRAAPADAATIAATLASAFGEDPVFRWMTGVADTERRLARFWAADVRAGLRHDDHELYLTGDGASAAFWRGVGRWKASTAEVLAVAPAALVALRWRLPRAMSLFNAMERAHPTEPHYYLESLGTRRGCQSRGGGSAVIAPVLARCDAEGVPAYLESSNPRNLAFYARHGFVERGVGGAPRGGPTMTTMWREPRG
jgi:GNAT superfamily N-acetyltransferase